MRTEFTVNEVAGRIELTVNGTHCREYHLDLPNVMYCLKMCPSSPVLKTLFAVLVSGARSGEVGANFVVTPHEAK